MTWLLREEKAPPAQLFLTFRIQHSKFRILDELDELLEELDELVVVDELLVVDELVFEDVLDVLVVLVELELMPSESSTVP